MMGLFASHILISIEILPFDREKVKIITPVRLFVCFYFSHVRENFLSFDFLLLNGRIALVTTRIMIVL